MGEPVLPAGSTRLGAVRTGHGEVEVWRLSKGASAFVSDLAAAYVAVVSEPKDSYVGPPVAMAVTVYDPDVAPDRAAELRDTPGKKTPGRWYGESRQVDNVFAYDAFRGGVIGCITASVVVGRFLFSKGCFETHSETRSAKGEHWAEAVGGIVPELLERPSGDLETHMREWLDALNDGSAVPDVP